MIPHCDSRTQSAIGTRPTNTASVLELLPPVPDVRRAAVANPRDVEKFGSRLPVTWEETLSNAASQTPAGIGAD